MREEIGAENLILIVIVALIITIFGFFYISGSLTNITGMAAGGKSAAGNLLAVYFILILIALTIAMIFLSEFIIPKNNTKSYSNKR